jgi:hypothetical protein
MIPATIDHHDEHDCGCSDECECHDGDGGVDYEEEGGDSIADIQHLAGIRPIAVVEI